MSLPRSRRAALCAAVLSLGVFNPFPALAKKAEILETGFTDSEVLAAFDRVLDDPYFEQFTGLTLYDKASLSKPARSVGATQSFKFVKSCVFVSVTELSGVRTKTTTRTSDTYYLAYMPTVEFTKKPGTVKLYCDAGEFGKDPGGKKGVSPFALLGGLLGAIGKGFSLGALGGRTWSGSDSCNYSPFNPAPYAEWMGKKWLPWRIKHFLPGGEDKFARAFEAFNKKRYDEALPLFEEFGAHFGYSVNKVPKNDREYKVWPFTYSSEMPEIFAILGDIYRLHVKDMTKAEEYYRIAYGLGNAPYLAEAAGINRANRGLGYILAERARAAASGPDRELFEGLSKGADFHLYAYLGAYKDRDAPDKAEVMQLLKLIEEADPEVLRQREKQAEARKEAAEERKEQKEKMKALMEY